MQVFDLPVHRVSSWIFNGYLVEVDDGRVLVVDAGLPVVSDQLATALREDLGRDDDSTVTIVATHGHSDHVGGVSHLCGALGDAATEVFLPDLCRSYLAGEKPRRFGTLTASVRFAPVWRQQPFDRRALAQFASTARTAGYGASDRMITDFDVTGFLAGGDTIVGASGWDVIHTPGHTDDSTCYYHRDSATLLAGDAVATLDGRAWFNPEYVDLSASRETEERLRSLDVQHLLPGHGLPISAPNVWNTARSANEPPPRSGFLASCSRRFGRWEN